MIAGRSIGTSDRVDIGEEPHPAGFHFKNRCADQLNGHKTNLERNGSTLTDAQRK